MNKLSHDLTSVINDIHNPDDVVLASARATFGIRLAADAEVGSVIDVTVQLADDAAFAALAGQVDVFGRIGPRYAAVRVPVAQLATINAIPGVVSIDVPQRLQSCMDTAVAQVNLATFEHRYNLTGKGVLIGIIDTGIDVTHPMFNGRIREIWDHTIAGVGWGGFPRGNILQGPAAAASVDVNGHGTHVAGIAAGADAIYRGVAPDAQLVIVKTDMTDQSIAAGLDYLAHYARNANLPMVANLSLGGHYDPHDGSGLLADTIDALSGPGFVVCCAAGNEGEDAIHAEMEVSAGFPMPIEFAVYEPDDSGILVKGWADFDADLSLEILSPDGSRSALFNAGDQASNFRLQGTYVTVVAADADPAYNKRVGFWVRLLPVDGKLALGRWQVIVRNNGQGVEQVHAWLVFNQQRAAEFTARSHSDAYKIGSPGAARQAITVGAATCRKRWVDRVGDVRQLPSFVLNAPCPFSSPGPLWGGVPKPELIAPGAMINSAAAAAPPKPGAAFQLADGGLRLMSGTSMASPFVAGMAALLLQKNPASTHLDIKNSLIRASRIAGSSGATLFQSKWGYGLLDASLL